MLGIRQYGNIIYIIVFPSKCEPCQLMNLKMRRWPSSVQNRSYSVWSWGLGLACSVYECKLSPVELNQTLSSAAAIFFCSKSYL